MKHILLASLSVLPFFIYGQSMPIDSIYGNWEGVITQGEGGYAPEYQFRLIISPQSDGTIVGRSHVTLKEIHATMEFKGEVIGDKTFSFRETQIINETSIEGMEWCYKNGFLIFSKDGGDWKLSGPWSGKTKDGSSCIAGEVMLIRKAPRA